MTVRVTGEPDRACHWWRQGIPRLDLGSFLYESKYRNFIALEKAKDNKRFLFFFLFLFFGWRHHSLLSIQVHWLPINRCIFFKKYSVEIIRVFLRPCLCSMGIVGWYLTVEPLIWSYLINLNSEFNRIVNWNIHFHVYKGKLNKRNKIKRMLHSLPGQFISNVMIPNLYNS